MATGLDLKSFALVGAQARLEELRREEAELLRAFPDLGRGHVAGIAMKRGPGRPRGSTNGGGAAKARKPYNMSAAGRKAVSLRMKKYWAARRKAKEAAAK